MGLITKVGDDSVSFSWPETELDEFIPVLHIISKQETKDSKTIYTVNEGDNLENLNQKVTLSEYIDSSKRDIDLHQVNTSKNKLKLSFKVEEGSSNTWDDDGYIQPQLSIEDENIKIVSNHKLLKRYGETIDVEIEIKDGTHKEFCLEFYANDDEDTFKGEYTNVFCGIVKIICEVKKLKQVFYAISLMQETDYRSNNFKYYKDFIKVKNSAFSHIEFGKYLSKESENVANDSTSDYKGEEIRFLAIFSHGYKNNIFGDSSDTINVTEIEAMFSSKYINFSKDSIIFLGACNSGTGKSSSFAQKLAEITNSKVIGMVDDGVAVVSETTGNSSAPKMIYGPKYGDAYNGKFYEFKKGQIPKLLSKEVDIIKLVETLKTN